MADINVLTRMPNPRGKNSALRFRGKGIDGFLKEFEHFATHANLTDDVKCVEIGIYFARKEKRVLEVLEGYTAKNWGQLQIQLRSLYTSSEEVRHFRPKDLQKFAEKERKISKLSHFDAYRREFLVIASSLEAKNALSGFDRDDYFWSGIQPMSLRTNLEYELKTKRFWTDLTSPPTFANVVEVATGYLKHDAYHPRVHFYRESSEKSKKKVKSKHVPDSDDETTDDDESTSDESGSESDGEEARKKKGDKKKGESLKKDEKKEELDGEKDLAAKELPAQSNIDDLTERFRQLELKLGEKENKFAAPRARTAAYCIMCGKAGHGIKECEQSRFLVTQGICRLDIYNRVVMSDGSPLPRAEGEGGAAKVIRERASKNLPTSSTAATSASNVEVVNVESEKDTDREELAVLGSMEYEVLPADRAERAPRAKPYERAENKESSEKRKGEEKSDRSKTHPNRAYVDLPPSILKRPPGHVTKSSVDDEKMDDVQEEFSRKDKGKQREDLASIPPFVQVPEVTLPPIPKSGTSAPKPAPKFDIKNPAGVPDRQKPAPQFKYASEIMSKVDPDKVFEKILDQPVILKLGEVLGTSFELG